MALWPRLAATGSPGTRWVTTNATRVIPISSTTPVPSRRSRKRRRSWRPPPERVRGRGATTAAGLAEVTSAELTQVDQPQRVGLQVLDRRGADQELGRLDQRHERAVGVHRLLDLLVQGLAGGVLGGHRGLGRERL